MTKLRKFKILYKSGSSQTIYGVNLCAALQDAIGLTPQSYYREFIADKIREVNGRSLAEWESMQSQWEEIREDRNWGQDGKPDRTRAPIIDNGHRKRAIHVAEDEAKIHFAAGYATGKADGWKDSERLLDIAIKFRDDSRREDTVKIDALAEALQAIVRTFDRFDSSKESIYSLVYDTITIADEALKKAGK